MMTVTYVLLFVMIGAVVMLSGKFCKGRLLTRPLSRRIKHWTFQPPFVRQMQLFVVIGVSFSTVPFAPEEITSFVYWMMAYAPYLDDYFNGHDDEWKKRLKVLKNKVKWRWLPDAAIEKG